MAGRIIRIIDKATDMAVMLLCLLMLFLGAYSLADNAWIYRHASDQSVMSFKPEPDATLSLGNIISEKQVAWLTINDTNIDYPLMQGEDNYEFLNKDPYGEFSLSGSIFLDSYNSPDFSDPYLLVYGHHMERGMMFGSLEDFLDKDYFEAHRRGSLATASQVFDLELFSVLSCDGRESVIFDVSSTDQDQVMEFVRKNSIFYKEPAEGRIIALSTCYGEEFEDRLLLVGKISPRQEDGSSPEE